MPISNVVTCRVGGNRGFEANCSGPCPNYDYRMDMRPENPAATYRRGEVVTVHWSKNNHLDGFYRLTLVPLDEMFKKDVHSMLAFHFGCWSAQEYGCSPIEKHRDCFYDRENKAYKTEITIPTVYPDGVYVLGWTWYGGGDGYGSFGDYYDCSYIRIKGGPLTDTYPVLFSSRSSPSRNKAPNTCLASVDRLGVCWTEPCRGEHWSSPKVPAELRNTGTRLIYRMWYESALQRPGNRVIVPEHQDFGINGFRIVDTRTEQELNLNQNEVMFVSNPPRITLLPILHGSVTAVEWYINGDRVGNSFKYPFSIAGEMLVNGRYNYFDWKFPIFNKRVFVTAIAWNNERRSYYSKDLVFAPRRW